MTGLPFEAYGRELPPEMETSQPYNPFAVDIWQLGSMIARALTVRRFSGVDLRSATVLTCMQFEKLPPPLAALVARMGAPDPAERPTAKGALAELTAWRASLTLEELRAGVHDRELLLSLNLPLSFLV